MPRVTKERKESFDVVGSVGVRRLLSSEIKVLREVAEKCNDAQTLVILDFLETDEGVSLLPLAMTLQMSAAFAAAGGLSERQWLQQLLSRHANDRESLETLWPALVDLRVNVGWPWPRNGNEAIVGPARQSVLRQTQAA